MGVGVAEPHLQHAGVSEGVPGEAGVAGADGGRNDPDPNTEAVSELAKSLFLERIINNLRCAKV